MKKEQVFITYMTFAGALTGLLIAAVLMAIAIPGYDNYLLTFGEKHQLDMMAKTMEWLLFVQNGWVMVPLSLVLGVITLVLFVRILNPNISMDTFKKITSISKLLAAMVLTFVVLPVLTGLLKEMLGIRSGAVTVLSTGQPLSWSNELVLSVLYHTLITYGLQFGVIWILIGEKGWLGDLTSWKMNAGTNRKEQVRTFVSGTAVGMGMAVTLVFQNWFFEKFFVLVSEVLDRSGETSFIGFIYLMVELILLFGVFAFIFAGLIVALAPVDRDAAYRRKKLIVPLATFIVMVSLMLSCYGYASYRYDLHKSGLAEAVGIPERASQSVTLLVMDSGDDRKTPLVLEWPLYTNAWGMLNESDIEVSVENLKKVEQYIEDHPQGSVFQYAAKDALYKGYYTLGEMEKGLEFQYKASADMLLPRVQLIKRLSHMPVTKKNIEYLSSFTDQTKWHVSGKYCLRLAKALIHQNRIDEARKWINKAGDRNIAVRKEEEVTIPDIPVFTEGKISGAVALNGAIPKDVKIMLFYDEGYPLVEQKDLSDAPELAGDSVRDSMAMRLVDVGETDEKGAFLFGNLGEGNYSLVIMASGENIPYDIPSERVRIKNNPGLFKLSRNNPVTSLGMIDVAVRK